MPTVMDSSAKADTCTHNAQTLPHGICKAFGELINTGDMVESTIKITQHPFLPIILILAFLFPPLFLHLTVVPWQ